MKTNSEKPRTAKLGAGHNNLTENTMRTKFEVWQWSENTGNHTTFIAHYETLKEAEACANKHGHCIVVQPSQEWTPLQLNGEPVTALPVILWIGGVGHVPFFSLFDKNGDHIGFVKRTKVEGRHINTKHVAHN